MTKAFTMDPKLDFAIERVIDAPKALVWEALTKPEHVMDRPIFDIWTPLGDCRRTHPQASHNPLPPAFFDSMTIGWVVCTLPCRRRANSGSVRTQG